MKQITEILDSLESGDATAASDLLPLVYDELRKLAAARLIQERPDHSLQATALVHEAWMRIAGEEAGDQKKWNSRGHFFAAAAEAMRRILIEHARAAKAQKRGGGRARIELDTWNHPAASQPEKLIALDEALEKLQNQDPVKAELVKLKFFAGLTIKESAAALDISTATAERYWAYARAWLQAEMQ
ncbi:ECF-type sigma factor [Crateriforma conspicua]|uniref:ECF sigma factor n=1 Tax=Crateriforma conspicua TaxID=2527996 RepID=A0A5C5YAA8_9PLAN|nr:ECF-type sigma factor [Crateriforma conspicua]QDV62070.1 ECF sigma factor [Crateriforma conspicua]TWT71763.1 ECF sigma factor [Crateriforma conspicua]